MHFDPEAGMNLPRGHFEQLVSPGFEENPGSKQSMHSPFIGEGTCPASQTHKKLPVYTFEHNSVPYPGPNLTQPFPDSHPK
jgi:hypothetical protein